MKIWGIEWSLKNALSVRMLGRHSVVMDVKKICMSMIRRAVLVIMVMPCFWKLIG